MTSEYVVLLIAALLGTTLLLRTVATPILETDSLVYHLPAVAQWYQAGTLSPVPRPDQIAYYPYDWELLSLLFVLPFGDDTAAAVPQVRAKLAAAE